MSKDIRKDSCRRSQSIEREVELGQASVLVFFGDGPRPPGLLDCRIPQPFSKEVL